MWRDEHFVLADPSALTSRLRQESWLLFVNASETHAPYLAPPELVMLQRRNSLYRNGKGIIPGGTPFAKVMSSLHEAQIGALELLDKRLKILFSHLPTPFDFLICADHGEAFGEDGLWGHVHSHRAVLDIPMWAGTYGESG